MDFARRIGLPQASNLLAASAMVLALGALGGCATMPTAPTMQEAVAVPEGWAMAEPRGVELDLATYWTLLDDPLITRFAEQAQRENLDIAQAATRILSAQAALRGARAGRLPSISGSGSAQRNVGGTGPNDLNISLGADISWEADLFGRISSRIGGAEANLLAAGYSRADMERIVVAQVVLQTIAAKSQATELEFSRASLAIQEENLQITRWRNQAGLVSSLDVEQARAQRAQIAASIPQAEAQLAATANAISTLLGETPGRVLAEIKASASIPTPPQSAGFAAPAEILRRRPDVRMAEARLAGDVAGIAQAKAQLSPLVRLSGSINTGSVGIGNLFDVITGNLLGSVSQLIFDGGAARSQVDQAEAGAEGSLLAWKQTILKALEDVETSSVQLRSARQRIKFFGEANEAAKNAALLARSQYQAGLVDFPTLLSAESQLLSTRSALIGAEAEQASAFVRLAQALGGGANIDASMNSDGGGVDPKAVYNGDPE